MPFIDVEVGFDQILYSFDQNIADTPFPLQVKLLWGELQRNVSLTIDLATNTSIASPTTNYSFATATTFMSGDSSGTVNEAILYIPSQYIVNNIEFVVTLNPIPEDKNIIKIINSPAYIKIVIRSKMSCMVYGVLP